MFTFSTRSEGAVRTSLASAKAAGGPKPLRRKSSSCSRKQQKRSHRGAKASVVRKGFWNEYQSRLLIADRSGTDYSGAEIEGSNLAEWGHGSGLS
jgi:hypothetical protein